MVSPRRIHTPDTVFHVRIRGIAGRPIFVDDDDRKRFLDVLERHLPPRGASIRQWALIPNHAHLKAAVTHTSLSEVMHRVNTEYAVYFNKRHVSQGHVFQDRYWRKQIDEEAYDHRVSGYIPANIPDAGLAPLEELATYRWSGFGAVMGTQPARLFHDVGAELASVAADVASARRIITDLTREAFERMAARRSLLDGVIGEIIDDVCWRTDLELEDVQTARTESAKAARREVIQRCLAARVPKAKLARALGLGRNTIYRHRG